VDQAVLVAAAHDVDIGQVERWSHAEGQGSRYLEFAANLERVRSGEVD
jgi:hypothetical protein